MIIYKITNNINNKIYIGQTSSPLRYRWSRHKKDNSNCIALKNAIKKYGSDSFTVNIISKCNSLKESNHREEYYIKIYKTLSPNGYNLLKGGNNRHMAECVKSKISKALKGVKQPVRNAKWCENISKAKKGRKINYPLEKISKKVKCLETNEIFASLSSVVRKYGGHTTNLSKHLNGKVKIFMGLKFQRYGGVSSLNQ